jgi:hypothetical protein
MMSSFILSSPSPGFRIGCLRARRGDDAVLGRAETYKVPTVSATIRPRLLRTGHAA